MLQKGSENLPALAVDVPEARSLRHDGDLTVRRVADLAELDAAVLAEVRTALGYEGSVAVIAADAATDRLRAALPPADARVAAMPADARAEVMPADARVAVMPATLVKGLEYDHVIVVEPAEIVAAEARGLHRLYVVLTRAVSRLAIVHTQPLPTPLTSSS